VAESLDETDTGASLEVKSNAPRVSVKSVTVWGVVESTAVSVGTLFVISFKVGFGAASLKLRQNRMQTARRFVISIKASYTYLQVQIKTNRAYANEF